jgi:hypothetical protein
LKGVKLSNRPADEANRNPELQEVTLAGVPVRRGDEPFAVVETGNSYKIEWKFGEWQEYKLATVDGFEMKKEQYNLDFLCTAGSFTRGHDIHIWMESEKENELYWRAPIEVPEEGLVVTLIFKLFDFRGGQDWIWGRVKAVRGEAVMPR